MNTGFLSRAAAFLSTLWGLKRGLLIGGVVGAGGAILIGGDIAFGWLAFWVALGAAIGAGVHWIIKNWHALDSL